jgi:Septum formation
VDVRLPLLLIVSFSFLSGCTPGVLELEVGQCFNDPPDLAEVEDVPVVDCRGPHSNEVVATFDIDGSSYPGEAAVDDLAVEGCEVRFAAYVGTPYRESGYVLGWFTPTAESWSVGDREVICFALDPGGAMIGSVRGSAT